MATAKTTLGIPRGTEFERETYEPAKVERVERTVKEGKRREPEVNDPLIRAAVEAANEVADSLGGTKLDVKYDTNTGMVVMAIMSSDGEKIIRLVPPEEMIRQAQRQKEQQARMLDSII